MTLVPPPAPILVSSCLMGLCTRYDGKAKPAPACIEALRDHCWLPVCPEQLGGLSTPRARSVLQGGDGHAVLAGRARVVRESGRDVTDNFVRGAELVLQIAELRGITWAALKSRSPSCAVRGTIGVTAALLESRGIRLVEF